MALRISRLALASVVACLSLMSTPSFAQPAPEEEAASAGIIQPGDEIGVRCFSHEKLHVYVRGTVLPDGTMALPHLGSVPLAGRGVQMVREELRGRYQEIYPRCSVNISVWHPQPEEPEEEGRPPTQRGPEVKLPLTVAPSQETRQLPVRAGDELAVRCFTGQDAHVDQQVSVSHRGTISLPKVPELYVAALRPEEVERALLANYRPLYPGCSMDVQHVGRALPTVAPPTGERVEPTVEVTAAVRFASLPRFGLDVFTRPERAEGPEPTTAGAPEEAGQPTVTQAVTPNYVLGPGDELKVRVWTGAIEHINTSAVIDADGKIYLELVNEVTVSGQRLSRVREELTRRYARFFDRAEVSVELARTRVIEVRVTGDAHRPGKQQLTGAATVFSALYAAGGPSEVGALRGIRLLRSGQEPMVIDLYDYLLKGDETGDVRLEPDDTIFIPPAQAMVGVTGEVRRPGRYELDAPIGLSEALEMAAGLAPTGYAHNVQVWRVAEQSQRRVLDIDLQGGGGAAADLPLRDGDLIVVQPVLEDPDNIVELCGAVRRPSSYEVFNGMTVRDLINQAQGLDDTAHTETAALWRLNDELDYELTDFDLAAAMRGDATHNLELQARDRVVVLSEETVEPPMEVEIRGAVRYPSIVTWTSGMRVSDLLLQGGGPGEDAYLARASLQRVGRSQRREHLSVNLAEALTRDENADVVLERGDILTVFARSEVVAPSQVHVSGFVQNPDTYPRVEQMRVSDAILAAGGLTERAGDEVEYTPGRARGEVSPQYLRLRLKGDIFEVEPDLVLGDDDHIAVLGSGELIAKPPTVTIKGRVSRPGPYAMRRSAEEPDTVWQLITRAEGMLADANPNGIVLYRLRETLITDEQDEDLQQLIDSFNREIREQMLESEAQRAAAMGEQITQGLLSVFSSEQGGTLVVPPQRLSAEAWVRAVPIDGELLTSTNGTEGDFPLEDGDVLVVPAMPTTVTVLGSVVRRGAVPYVEGQPVRQYLEYAGGATDTAWLDHLVIVRANGKVEAHALGAEVKPGDVILVPSTYIFRKIDSPTTFERVLSILGTFVTGYLLFK